MQTKVIPKTLNPVYNQDFILSISPAMLREQLAISVWDKNAIQKNVFIGSVEFQLAELLKTSLDFEDSLNVPEWYPLTNPKKPDVSCGDILLQVGLIGTMEPNLKQVVNGLECSDTASLLTSDDPADEIYFNHVNFGEKPDSVDQLDSLQNSDSGGDISFESDPLKHSDLLGLLLIKVVGANNLPLEKSNIKRFNCDPFCVIQFGHTLNPQWNETVYFHLKQIDITNDWPIHWCLYDFERFTKNNAICEVTTSLSQILAKCETPIRSGSATTVYRPTEVDFELAVLNQRTVTLGSTPTLKIQCSFIPYTEIRRNFWLALLSQYSSSSPTDETPTIDKVSFVTMLDAIESNISDETINNMFAHIRKAPTDEITFTEAIELLETKIYSSTQVHPIGMQNERLMELKFCPICEKRLRNRGDFDAVTHLALCSHGNLDKLDKIESASSKWVTKIFSYVTFGGLGIGKNSGHILYQDREVIYINQSGQLLKEKIPSYIRLGIRLLYQVAGSKSAVESKAIKKLLRNMTIKQGVKFESPKSVSYISQFIAYHDLDLDEVLDPLESFKNFNEFFYRKLKPGSRILASPNPSVAICPADARTNCFQTIKESQDLWIKGSKFSVESLIEDHENAERFKNGSIAVFRLAPQVDGKIVSTKHIEGAYFTVNPMAVRTSVDVFVENVRTVTIIDSVAHGRVAYVCIGAMLVGSIIITTKEGQQVQRMDEHGYFKFGGSSIVLIFEKGRIQFDKDLLDNSNTSLETLVKMGNSLGKGIEKE